jgi:hypothetical protein
VLADHRPSRPIDAQQMLARAGSAAPLQGALF